MGLKVVRKEVVSVATARTRLARANPKRVRMTFTNQGSVEAYTMNSLDVAARGLGHPLEPRGTHIIKPETDGQDVMDEWHGIADVSVDVLVVEYEEAPDA